MTYCDSVNIDHSISIAVVYNMCACPSSYFVPDAAVPTSMEVVAASNSAVQATVPPHVDAVNLAYGQDCGGFLVKVEPEIAQLELLPGDKGYTLSLVSALTNDLGVYKLDIIIY